MFKPRGAGTTLLRPPTAATVIRRRIERAVHDPHAAAERFDPDFELVLHCAICGRAGTAPRRLVADAVRAHVEERHADHDGPVAVRVLYPRQ